jgi:transcriptional regulator with XRE-family HTH domain
MAAAPSRIIARSEYLVYLTAIPSPATVLRPAVTENAGGDRMRGATSKTPGKRIEQPAPSEYGRGTGVPNPIDVEVGGRVRTRRLLLGMNQQALADGLDLTFQQVQKYEHGATRVSASRLAAMAKILAVPISYFFADLQSDGTELSIEDKTWRERLQRPETIELIRLFYAISNPEIRRQFLEMAKSMGEGGARSRAAGPTRPS